MSPQKLSQRELYRQSADRIGLALDLFGAQASNLDPADPTEENRVAVHRLVNQVVIGHGSEPENNYKATILQVGKWLCGATTSGFLEENREKSPHGHYVVRKGMEVLHMLLHRDLRRKVFSSTESQVYYNFVRLTGHLPNPSREAVDPDIEETEPVQRSGAHS